MPFPSRLHAANAFRIVNQQATHSVGILLQLLLGLGTAPFLIRLYTASRHIQNAANFGILQAVSDYKSTRTDKLTSAYPTHTADFQTRGSSFRSYSQ